MAKLQKKSKGNGKSSITKGRTLNKEGSPAFELKDKQRLVTGVLTCLVNEPKFYGDTTNDIIKCAREMIKKDPNFVAKLAVYTRKELHLRTISQVLVAELGKGARYNTSVRKATRGIIERPDDMTGILSYHLNTWGPRKKGNSIPRSIRRGIADSFHKFDEYQLAKYKGTTKDVKLKDALSISHPRPTSDEQAKLWKRLIENTLKTPETRETILSSKGQSKEVWEDFIDSGKMGYMAMLRNLKNMLQYSISDKHLNKVIDRLRDPNAVRRSKQLPFRFFSAYKMLKNNSCNVRTGEVLDALEDALMISFENLPALPGVTALINDESGSMTWSCVSKNSIIRLIDVGNILGAGLSKTTRGVVIPFGTTAKTIHFQKRSSIFDNMNKLENLRLGCGTYLQKAFDEIDALDTAVDRIIIFSDMQCYGSFDKNSWVSSYRKKTGKNVWIHSIDLQGYGTTKLIGNRVNLIAGWSDKVLEYIANVENGGSDLVKTIEKYNI